MDDKIRRELLERGFTLSRVAAILNVSPATISKVVRGKASSFRVKRLIAALLGKHINDVFPGSVDQYGQQSRLVGRPPKAIS